MVKSGTKRIGRGRRPGRTFVLCKGLSCDVYPILGNEYAQTLDQKILIGSVRPPVQLWMQVCTFPRPIFLKRDRI